MAHLIEINTNKITFLTDKVFSIGRSLQNSMVVEDLPVSRVHCIFKEGENGRWNITDKSSNGTLVNKVLIKNKSITLENDDVVELCSNFRYIFKQPALADQSTVDDAITSIVNEIVCDEGVLKEFLNENVPLPEQTMIEQVVEPVPVAAQQTSTSDQAAVASTSNESDLSEEMQCSICTELFVNATTLNCSHTFCKYCIGQWTKKNRLCPICRTKITSQIATRVIDNCIEKYLKNASEDERQHRSVLLKERASDDKEKKPSPRSKRTNQAVLVVSSDSDEEEDFDYDDSDAMMHHDYGSWGEEFYEWVVDDESEVEYDGLPGHYYGGYGHCYSCGARGHWANGCPN